MDPIDDERPKSSLQRLALEAPRLELEDLADAMKKSKSSTEAYLFGRTTMPADARLLLAVFLRRHAEGLIKLSDELMTSVE